MIKKEDLKKLKERRKESKKGDFGRLLVIGGNKKYVGSSKLNALAGLAMSGYRVGVDLVIVVSVERVADIVAENPNIITTGIPGEYLKRKHLKILLKESRNKTGFVIGGGLGREKTTMKLVRGYLKKIDIPGVIDADGIYALNKKVDLSNFVVTPHAYEFKILTGEEVKKKLEDRKKQVKKSAKKLNTVILLKGKEDVISDGREVRVNKTGNKYMTVGGTGDVLAGILASLIAQGNSNFEAAIAASYINGRAGEETKRKRSLVATDLINKIGEIADSI
jgi:NAD(P)H-hydrate epimerase